MTIYATPTAQLWRAASHVTALPIDDRRAAQALRSLGCPEQTAQAIAAGALNERAGAIVLARTRGLVA